MSESIFSEIPSELVRTALYQTIENELQSTNYNVNLSVASKVGVNNFIGNIYRVSFSKKNVKNNEENPTKMLILKTAPDNSRRQYFFVRSAFVREVFMYDKVLPFFRQFERSKNVDIEENGFNEYPMCFRTVDVNLNEALIFEDMCVHNFTIIDRHREDITAEHVYLVMKTLGKYHAISFALKDQQPNEFNELTSNLSEVFICKDDSRLGDIINQQSEIIRKVVSGKGDEHLLAKVQKFCEKGIFTIATDCLDIEATGAATVISHGDTWQNNIMFKCDNNGKPKDVCFLDWQTSRHCSPIIDILYFIFFCTTKKLRDVHYKNFLEVYYDSLCEHIKKLGSDPEKLFPRELMLKHLHQFAKFTLIISTLVLPMITTDSEHLIDLDAVSNDLENGKENIGSNIFITDQSRSKLHERLRDVIVDMARLEYI